MKWQIFPKLQNEEIQKNGRKKKLNDVQLLSASDKLCAWENCSRGTTEETIFENLACLFYSTLQFTEIQSQAYTNLTKAIWIIMFKLDGLLVFGMQEEIQKDLKKPEKQLQTWS